MKQLILEGISRHIKEKKIIRNNQQGEAILDQFVKLL